MEDLRYYIVEALNSAALSFVQRCLSSIDASFSQPEVARSEYLRTEPIAKHLAGSGRLVQRQKDATLHVLLQPAMRRHSDNFRLRVQHYFAPCMYCTYAGHFTAEYALTNTSTYRKYYSSKPAGGSYPVGSIFRRSIYRGNF